MCLRWRDLAVGIGRGSAMWVTVEVVSECGCEGGGSERWVYVG